MSGHECATLHHSRRAALDAGNDLLWGADLRNVSSHRSVLEHGLLRVEKGLILLVQFPTVLIQKIIEQFKRNIIKQKFLF